METAAKTLGTFVNQLSQTTARKLLSKLDEPWDRAKYESDLPNRNQEVIEQWEKGREIRDKLNFTSLLESEWTIEFDRFAASEHVKRVMAWHPEMKKGLLLLGPVGTGKSSLCKALINRWSNPNRRAMFITIGDAMDKLKAAIDSETTSVEAEMMIFKRVPMLFLDDLGVEKNSVWQDSQFQSIFDHRSRLGLHTFFTTNLDGNGITAKYGPRIFDRLKEFCSVIPCVGDSYRSNKFQNEV